MRTSALPLAALGIALAASACAPTAEDLDSTAQELNAVSPPFSGAALGVVRVRVGATQCTGVMLDAVTVFTAGPCTGPRARDYTVQLGAETLTASQVRFTMSGVALLRLPRVFAGMAPGFTRRVSTRTAAQLDGHTMSCFAYNAQGALVQASMSARAVSGAVELRPVSQLNAWDAFDRGALCMDSTANSQDLDALVLTASAAANVATAAAGGGGIGGWSDFVRTLTWPQMALVMEVQGTGNCLAFDYVSQRIVISACNQGDPRQGLYQEVSGNGVRLRGADNAACVMRAGALLRYNYCAGGAPASANTFALQWTGSAYRIVSQGACVAVRSGAINMVPCSGADATQRFTMRLSSY